MKGNEFAESSGSQSGIPGAAASMSPGNDVLDMKILGPHPVRRLVWAGKHQLGNAAWGASFPSERALPAGGFGSVHTPSP